MDDVRFLLRLLGIVERVPARHVESKVSQCFNIGADSAAVVKKNWTNQAE